jgi:hypothetical protein
MKTRRALIAATVLATVLSGAAVVGSQAQEAKPQVKMTLKEARQTVDMLNDLYVTAVVGIHGTYVKDKGTPAAAVVARQLFKTMEAKGWPQTRWLSNTGKPFNPDANPKDQFEKDASAALKTGKAKFERVENGKLRVATLVPIVDKTCLMCHLNNKVGDPIGGLSYTVNLSD